jgi:hypothetical protein
MTETKAVSYEPNRYLWGFYNISVDQARHTWTVMPLRQAATHWNTLKWLEQGPCTNCVKILGIEDSGFGYKDVDVQITHPFGSMNLTGFDVRGVAIFNGSVHFPEDDLYVSDRDLGDGDIIGEDGYTGLYAGWTAGAGPSGLQGYVKGKFATPTVPSSDVNGFMRFVSTDPANTRNAFYAGDSITVTYGIYMPTTQFVFGYAVDACWVPPTTKPVTDPMVDFPPEANCPEPWRIVTNEAPESQLTIYGGSVDMLIDVYDWQGKASYQPPTIECPDLFAGTVSAFWVADGPDYAEYKATITNELLLAVEGYYRCLIKVVDNANSSSPPEVPLIAYDVMDIYVWSDNGWVKTIGSPNSDIGYSVDTDSHGNIYIAGVFSADSLNPMDFDPGYGTDYHVSNGAADAFVAKFNSSGTFVWARTWGGSSDDIACGVDASESYVRVAGFFHGTVDFDPSSGVDTHMSNGDEDCFVSTFDPDGPFLWVTCFGGADAEQAVAVSMDSASEYYVSGLFYGTADFDPGPGVDEHTAGPWTPNAFLSKYTWNGVYQWTRTWGGSSTGTTLAIGLSLDALGNPYVCGYYRDTVDFDAGYSTDEHTSNGGFDIYLSYFESDGDFTWARTWGGPLDDYAQDVVSDADNEAFIAGGFQNTVDFDPGSGVDNHVSAGGTDAFLCRLSSAGDYVWGLSWGGTQWDEASSVAVAWNHQSVFVTGEFCDTVDFDPGPDALIQSSTGGRDAFLSFFKFDSTLIWAVTVGGPGGDDFGNGVACSPQDHAFVIGSFEGTSDFDPVGSGGSATSNGNYDVFLDKILYTGGW